MHGQTKIKLKEDLIKGTIDAAQFRILSLTLRQECR